MPTRLLTDVELAQLTGYPSVIAAEDLTTFFRLDSQDRRWVLEDHRGPGKQLGLALQLCTLPWLGFVPDDLTAAPAAAVGRLADQLAVDPAALAGYGGWKDRTRTEHLREVLARLGWSTARAGAVKVLDDFLIAQALEHDSPTLLLQLAGEHLRAERVVRPALRDLLRRVAAARAQADPRASWGAGVTSIQLPLPRRDTEVSSRSTRCNAAAAVLSGLRRSTALATRRTESG